MSAEKKIAEGTECIQQAEKYLKTSFMKWRPDYDSAASEYSRAATCFRTAKVLDQCKDCLMKAAECYSQNHSFFSAAKSYELAAFVCKEMDDYVGAARMAERACELFREHGTPDSAALTLEKGAKLVESKLPEVALELYKKAAEVVMIEDRPRQASEFVSKAARISIKLNRYDEATDLLQKQMEYYLSSEDTKAAGRLVIAQILVHLVREDFVAADKAFREGNSYMEREECNNMSLLLDGYDQGDDEQVSRSLNHPFIKHMDTEYAKLARTLQAAAAGGSTGLGSFSTGGEGGSRAAGTSHKDDDDEFAGGLM